jgi:hypothetical protein
MIFIKRNQYALTILAVWVLFFINCSGPDGRNIIPEKKFVNVLVDIHLADGIAVINMNSADTFRLDSASLYGSVLKKYKVTRAQFDSTMVFYSSHPGDFQEIYNKVIAKLKRMEDELNREAKDSTEVKKGRAGTGDK